MDRDGTRSGFDLDLLRAVCGAVRVPVVASGGVGALAHFVEGAEAGASGLLAASVFHFGQFAVADVKRALRAAGQPVRPTPPRRDARDDQVAEAGASGRPRRRRRRQGRGGSCDPQEGRRQEAGGRRPGARCARRCRWISGATAEVLDRLFEAVTSRRDADPTISHSARLLSRGTAKVAQKFGEEAVECLIEAVGGNAGS